MPLRLVGIHTVKLVHERSDPSVVKGDHRIEDLDLLPRRRVKRSCITIDDPHPAFDRYPELPGAPIPRQAGNRFVILPVDDLLPDAGEVIEPEPEVFDQIALIDLEGRGELDPCNRRKPARFAIPTPSSSNPCIVPST